MALDAIIALFWASEDDTRPSQGVGSSSWAKCAHDQYHRYLRALTLGTVGQQDHYYASAVSYAEGIVDLPKFH
jgi:hypothetical protein